MFNQFKKFTFDSRLYSLNATFFLLLCGYITKLLVQPYNKFLPKIVSNCKITSSKKDRTRTTELFIDFICKFCLTAPRAYLQFPVSFGNQEMTGLRKYCFQN